MVFFTDPMLVQGRAKLIEQDNAKRYKLLTKDDNEVDAVLVDNRGVNANGKTLVICSEGMRFSVMSTKFVSTKDFICQAMLDFMKLELW